MEVEMPFLKHGNSKTEKSNCENEIEWVDL